MNECTDDVKQLLSFVKGLKVKYSHEIQKFNKRFKSCNK